VSRNSSRNIRSEGRRTWHVNLSLESRKLNIAAAALRKMVLAILAQVEKEIKPQEVHELSVIITDDKRIRVLNREFRRKDKATDVLSFPQLTKAELFGRARGFVGSSLGDLVISSETTLRQAKEFGVAKREELLRLLVHGVLHLCGYDHEKVPHNEAQRMRRQERAIRGRLLEEFVGRRRST
jgi:probable rRNA maturation factor